jgi:WD40 repeat protein
MTQNYFLLNLARVCPIFVMAACAGSPLTSTAQTSQLPAITPTIRELQPAPENTPTPLATQSPTLTPEIEIGPQIIAPGNAGQVVQLAKLGKGTILSNPFDAPEGMPIYSPDGLWLAIPTSAGIYMYDAVTLDELHRIPVETSFIAFSPDSSLLAASRRGAVSLWDPATGDQVGELLGSPDDVHWELSFSPDGLLLAAVTWNREISVWSLESKERQFTFPGDRLRFSPDGELAVVVVYGENRVQLYETHGGSEVNKWNVRHAGFTPGGQLWLEDSESVRLVYIDRDLVTAPFSGTQPSFSKDGTLMALFANGQISLYDHAKGRRTQILEGSYPQIDGVLFSPDGQTLAGDVYTLHCPACTEMDGLDRSLILWRTSDGSIINRLKHPSGWIAYSVDGSMLAAVQMENVQILKASEGSMVNQIDGFTAPVGGMALSPSGKTLAAIYVTEPYTLRLWDFAIGRVNHTLRSQTAPNLSTVEAAYSPDEKYIAVGGDLWDLAAGEQMTALEEAISAVTSCWTSGVAFSPQGDTLATGCFYGQLDLWGVPDGTSLKRFGGYSSWVNELAYSPDGKYLAAIYDVPDYLVQVWQLPKGKASFTLTGGHFTRVTYSADGRILATVSAKEEYDQYGWPAGFVQLWSASDGKELLRLEIEDAVSLAFSPNSQILATGSLDGTLRLWEIAAGRMLMEASGHYGQIERLVFTPDGTSLISGSQDGTILRWGIPKLASSETAFSLNP